MTLTVTDDGGATGSSTQSVTVNAGAPSGNFTGVWTDAAGAVITSASVGQTVKLQLCTTESSINAFQADVPFDVNVVTPTATADLDATMGAGVCSGPGPDVLNQFTGNPAGAVGVALLNFTISASPGTGVQGLGGDRLQVGCRGHLLAYDAERCSDRLRGAPTYP